jgi:hypothetical protein
MLKSFIELPLLLKIENRVLLNLDAYTFARCTVDESVFHDVPLLYSITPPDIVEYLSAPEPALPAVSVVVPSPMYPTPGSEVLVGLDRTSNVALGCVFPPIPTFPSR